MLPREYGRHTTSLFQVLRSPTIPDVFRFVVLLHEGRLLMFENELLTLEYPDGKGDGLLGKGALSEVLITRWIQKNVNR